MSNTVNVTCPCGTRFEREVKRGRPQVWCATCAALPHASRTGAFVKAAVSVPAVAGESVEPETEFDPQAAEKAKREALAVKVTEIHTEFQKIKPTLIAQGIAKIDPSLEGYARARAIRQVETDVYFWQVERVGKAYATAKLKTEKIDA